MCASARYTFAGRVTTHSPGGDAFEYEVGDTIWAVGNDSGEKVVIHESTLARKDRLPPSYDLNIAYWQAATDVAGGGSALLNCSFPAHESDHKASSHIDRSL